MFGYLQAITQQICLCKTWGYFSWWWYMHYSTTQIKLWCPIRNDTTKWVQQ